MGLTIRKGKYHRMPVFFGPTDGPRQWPVPAAGFDATAQRTLAARYSFMSDAEQLESFLPQGFTLWGDPIVALDVTWMTDIPWLAGRGYAMSDFKFMACYDSREGPVHGTFVLVRWENLTDPILSGRDELGHNKLYCEIPDFVSFGGRHRTQLSWQGFTFADVEFWDFADATPPAPHPLNRGQLSFKFVPRTGCPGEADAAYATLSPLPKPGEDPRRLVRYQEGQGRFDYRPARWEDFPFSHHVVSAIAGLKNRGFVSAQLWEFQGSGTFSGEKTHILEAAQ